MKRQLIAFRAQLKIARDALVLADFYTSETRFLEDFLPENYSEIMAELEQCILAVGLAIKAEENAK